MKNKVFRRTTFLVMVFLIIVFVQPIILLAEDNKNVNNKENAPVYTYDNWYQSSVYYSYDYLDKIKIPREVKGLYVTGYTAGGPRFDHLIDLLNKTELNSLVIDVKEDKGLLTYNSNVPLVDEIKSDRHLMIKDIDGLLQKAQENNIYTIARIVTFKDPFFAGAKPELAMKKKSGGVWRDRKGVSWIDPYRKDVWDYNIAIAKEAAEKGFDEIQFDYVRFPENGKKVDREVAFDNPNKLTKAEVIAEFLAYAKEKLQGYPVYISADVFGLTTTVVDDMGIGQQWELITPIVDYISPMMYPSHYANGSYGLSVPDAYPYETIKNGLQDGEEKNQKVNEQGKATAIIRPWYQDFTATWVKGHIKYGSEEVKAQIKGGYDLEINQYLIWDPNNTYSEEAWLSK